MQFTSIQKGCNCIVLFTLILNILKILLFKKKKVSSSYRVINLKFARNLKFATSKTLVDFM